MSREGLFFCFHYYVRLPFFGEAFLYIRGMKELTRNEVVELMLVNNTSAFRLIAGFIESYEMDWKEAVDYLRECADEMEAQSVVVRMRDELGFDKPVY